MSSIQDVAFEDEDILVGKSSNAADAKFDLIIGSIEDIIMEPKFQELQDDFMDKNYKHFEENDENKLIYTTIHKEYINLIEKYLETQLKKRVENFSMDEFMKDLLCRRNELDGEIFEILLTFEDFLEFKQLMLSYRASKEGKSIDLSLGLSIQSINVDGSFKQSISNNANKNTNTKKPKDTPLLDKTQVDHIDDSDNE